jgi:biotin carboxyl carrier protein
MNQYTTMEEEEKGKPKQPRYKSLVIDNVKYRTLHTKKFSNRTAYEELNPFKMKAFIPGTIISIHVKEGKKVKQGETLLILEAMKMMNEVKAPENTTVKKIYVVAGDRVSKDQLMIELE